MAQAAVNDDGQVLSTITTPARDGRAEPAGSSRAERATGSSRAEAVSRFAGAGALVFYAALSLFCWHYLITAGISTHMYQTGIGDVGEGIWYTGWLPYALGHGLNPFWSDFMFAPQGFNLVANTNFFPQAFLLAPVTVIFSPLVSFNVACILAPIVTAGVTYFVLRRLDFSSGIAFVGGLVYGFSPGVMQEARLGHFQVSWMFFPPLLLLLLERLFVRQQGSALRYGLALGAITVVQFFNSPEILLDCALLSLVAVVVLAAVKWCEVPSHARFALTGLGTALVLAGALLAYPLYYFLAGPGHMSHLLGNPRGSALVSPVWPALGTGTGFLVPPPGTPLLQRFDVAFIGPVVVALALSSLAFAQRRRLVVLVLGTALVSYVLSWGTAGHTDGTAPFFSWHAPAYFLQRVIPIFGNVDWVRISAITNLLLVVATAVAMQEIGALIRARSRGNERRLVTMGLGTLAALTMAVPVLVAGGLPVAPIEAVAVPPILKQIPAGVHGGPPIALVYPVGGVFNARTLAWQALAGYTWRDWAGYAWHPKPGTPGDGYVGPNLTEADLLTGLMAHEATGTKLTATERAQIRTGLAKQGIEYAVVIPGWAGSEKMEQMLTQVYGRPRTYPSGSIWRTGS